MIVWILASLVLFVVQTLIAPSLQYLTGPSNRWARIREALGPRDNPPPMPVYGQRAGRALLNMGEALPVFLTIALLLMIANRADALAQQGAMIFFIARLIYVPSYMSGIAGLRTVCWIAAWVGLAMMLVSLLR